MGRPARCSRRQFLRRVLLVGAALPGGALAACQGAAPPPTPQPLAATPRAIASPSPLSPTQVAAPEPGSQLARLVLEAEDFRPRGAGWRPIRVGEGNYMVDSIGASHISGEALLHAPADADGATASLETEIPRAGRYKVWARYEYPYRDYHVLFQVSIEQPGRAPIRLEYGRPEATRLWFFNLPDAPGTT